MRRDPKAFRERFKAWKNGQQVYYGGRPTELSGYEGGKNEDDITTLRELTVTPNGSYAPVSPDDMKFNLEQAIDARISKDRKDRYTLLRNMNVAQEAGAATIGGALASIVGDPLGYGLIKGGASLLNAAKNLPQFARRIWNGGNIIQRNIPISPKNYYRTIIGNDALNDALNTGIIRGSKSFNGAPYFSHNGLIVQPAGKHAYVIEGTPSTPVQWTGAYQFRVPSKLRPNGSYIPIERIPDASPKSMLPVSEDILTEAIPWSNGSYQVPTNGFTYWQKHPIIGWRNHSFASRSSNMPYVSQWDLANAYADAKAYADSPLRVQLFEQLKKEAADAGYISQNSLLQLGRMHSKKPQIRFEDLGPDVLGKYLSDKHQIQLNITDPNPLTSYHEYLHSLDVGRPFKDSFTLTKKYKQLKRKATKFGDQEAAKEMMRYSDDAYGMDDFYTHKANHIIESSADPYYKDPLEIDAYGLQEGKRLSMPIFSPKPSDEVLQRMYQQSLNGPYGHFFKHLKVGDNTLNTYWKLLSGQFLPIGLGGAYIMNQNYKNGKDSGIHIKPENRGKFTALKKRTGHSASWFKAHGTPAQKKMATFALNARKWKH